MFVDVRDGAMNWRDLYHLCISFIVPRPIALVGTISPGGRHNLAPFSFYNMVCANPPVVMISNGLHRDGSLKHTCRNIEATREFSIATVTADIGPHMVRSAAELPYGESEFPFSGLTPAPARFIRAPLVAEARINLECSLRQVIVLGEGPGSSHVMLGDIVAMHIADEVLDASGACAPHKLTAVGRLGGKWYTNTTSPYEMSIPPAS
ncbi:MAG: flavin reductase family protein [Phycisphaerales bacterium]|nr:flavin reductase family protein [Phycisphaerales bacterium]